MNKIKLVLGLLVLITFNNCFAQVSNYKLVGVWQVNTAKTGDAWLSNYRFFNNGTFKYTFNQYDDRGRNRAAKGSYKLKGDTLTLLIKTRTEIVGGDLTEGSPGFQQEELILDGGKVIEVKQKTIKPIIFVIQWFKKQGIKGFKIQNNSYYLISTDAHKEDE